MAITDSQLISFDVVVKSVLVVDESATGYVTSYVPDPRTFGDLEYSNPVIESSDINVLTVVQDEDNPNAFVVTAVSEGSASISVTVGSVTSRAAVLVRASVPTSNHVTISAQKSALVVDEVVNLTANATNNRRFKLVSSDSSVLEVVNGKIVALNEGSAFVKAIGLNVTSNRCYATVRKVAKLTEFSINLPIDGVAIGVEVEPTYSYNVPGTYSPVLTSSDTSVAIINNEGNVVSVGEGRATITADIEGLVASTVLEVVNVAISTLDSVSVSGVESGVVGTTGSYGVTLDPVDALDPIEVVMDPEGILEFDESEGTYLRSGVGSTTVTFRSKYDHAVSDSIEVEVTPI